jgi:hypothetical protein
MDAGDERITDPAELAQVRRQSRTIHLKSLVLAGVLTAALVLL